MVLQNIFLLILRRSFLFRNKIIYKYDNHRTEKLFLFEFRWIFGSWWARAAWDEQCVFKIGTSSALSSWFSPALIMLFKSQQPQDELTQMMNFSLLRPQKVRRHTVISFN